METKGIVGCLKRGATKPSSLVRELGILVSLGMSLPLALQPSPADQ